MYSKIFRFITTVFLLVTFAFSYNSNAQVMSNYSFTPSTGATLIDISSGYTTLVTNGVDDTPSGLFDIGFNFVFMGNIYTQFSASPDGFLKFGSPAASSQYTNSLTSTTNVPKVAPYWDDLATGTDGYVIYKTIGTAPSRQLVVEWFVTVPRNTSGAATAKFQAVISEGTGTVDFVYNAIPTGTASYSVGMTSSATEFASVTTSTSTVSYSTANDSQTDAIAVGTQYNFAPPATVPNAPTNLSFTNVTGTGMTLNWTDNATNETGYVILKSIDDVTYDFEALLAADAVTYDATGLTLGTLYYWHIYAVTEGMSSTALAGSQATPSGSIFGTKYIPGDYATIEAAVLDLNSGGVGPGGVTYIVAAGHTESITAPITITMTGTAANPIAFQTAGGGTNPLVTRTDNGSLSTSSIGAEGDAIFRLEGTDYITFDGIDVAADSAGIEYGYLTFKPDGANGCQYVTITNCVITMAGGYSIGINIGNGSTSTSSATGVTVTDAGGMNTNITITGNTIQNVLCGMYFRGSTAMYDTDFTIGESGAGNIIQNYSGTVSTSTYGMYFIYVNNPNVQYNTITNAATPHTSTLYSIFFSIVTGDLVCSNNNMTLANNAASSSTYFIYSSNSCNTEVYENNTFASSGTLPSGSLYFLYSTGSTPVKTVTGNTTSGSFVKAGGGLYGYYVSGTSTTHTISDNTLSNIVIQSGSSSKYCYYLTSTGTNKTISGNTLSNIDNSAGTGTLYGLYCSGGGDVTMSGNTVDGLSGGSTIYGLYGVGPTNITIDNNTVSNIAGSSTIYGFEMGGTTAMAYNNNVFDLEYTGTSTSILYGIYSTTGTDVTWYNNFISDLRAPNGTSTTGAVRGFYISSGTNVNLYYNTIYLDNITASSAALYASTTPTSIDLRDNIFVNNVDNSGGGTNWAFRGGDIADLAATTNNNLYYAGTPSATNLIYYDGTNTAQTLTEYKNLVTPRESASVASLPPFVNVTTTPYDLHMSTTTPTQTESGGTPVAGITTDYDGDTRNATTPDIGADEFNGIGADLTPPDIVYTSLPNHNYTQTSVSLTATITDASGVAGGSNLPRLYLKKINDVSYVFDNNPGIAGDDYTFTINYTAIGGVSIGDTIVYYVAAQDVNDNVATNPAGGSGVNPPGTTPPAVPNGYIITDLPLSGTYTIGLSDFIKKTGRQIYFETRTRTVRKNINGVDAVNDINAPADNKKLKSKAPDLSAQYVTVTETYKQLMENGKPFDTKFFQSPQSRGDYPTITAAINDLNLRGVSGPVTFLLADAFYPNETYPIDIYEVVGASSTNTITIKPATGVQAEIPGDPAQTAATLRCGYGDWVIVDGSNTVGGTTKDLKIVGLASGTIPAIHLWGDASNNVFKNLIVESQNNTSGSGTFLFGSGPFASDNNVVENCTIKNIDTISTLPGVGVYFFSTNTGTGNQIIDCSIYDWYYYGVRLQGAPTTNTLISGCDVYMTAPSGYSSPYGIYISRVDGLIVEKCKIRQIMGSSTVKGIYIPGNSTSGDFTFKNNFISLSGSTNLTTGSIYGFDYWGYAANSVEAYSNSIYIGGTDVTSGTTYAFAKRDAATTFKVYDNAVQNARSNSSGTGKHYAVYVSNTSATTFEMNYNDYYADGTGGVFGYYSADVADLTAWQTASGMDANSISGDPGYIGNDDLHIKTFVSTLDGKGLYFASVPDDIDGDTRNSTTPDIGADEYTYVPPSVLDPTDVTATAVAGDQIDIAFTPNANSDSVVIVYNMTGTFTTPSGPPPSPGNPFAGGTLIANTTISPFNHTGLIPLTTYYYRLFSYDGVNYSFGVNANATTPCGTINTFPYVQNFDNGGSIPDCWEQDPSNTENWLFGTTATYAASSDHTSGSGYFAWIDDSTPDNAYPSGLVSPTFDVTGLTTPLASFWYWIGRSTYPGGSSFLNVDVSTDGGITWVDSVITALVQNNQWDKMTINLTSYSSANLKLRFSAFEQLASAYTCDLSIDDFELKEAPTSPVFVINPTSNDYGTAFVGDVISQDFTILNDGGGTLTINSGGITLAGSNPGDFTIGSITYPINLGAGESANITVSFTPATVGSKSADLQIVHNATGSPAIVPLTGFALPAGILYEDFTGTTFPPAGWITVNNDGGSYNWARYTGVYHSPPASAYSHWESSSLQNDDWLITPKLAVTSGDSITFFHAAYSASFPESLYVMVGTTNDPNTGTWDTLAVIYDPTTNWDYEHYDLTAYAGQNVYVAFVNRGLDEFYLLIDDVMGPVIYLPAVDLAFTDFYQDSGLPVDRQGEEFTNYKISMNPEFEAISKPIAGLIKTGIGTRALGINNSEIINNKKGSLLYNDVTVKGVVQNYGTNAASYNMNWDVSGTAQTPYTGPSVVPSGSDTASLTYTPTDIGTFLTTGTIVVTGDEVLSNNDATPFHMLVYPDSYTRTIYDRGDNLVDTWVGWGTSYPTERMKAGVRFTASEEIQMAGVDFICRTETVTSGDFQVQVRAAGADTLAPGAVLYTKIYTSNDYFAGDGAYIFFPFDGTAPTIAAGSDYWITIKAPLGVLYPGGVHNNGFTPGRSFYEQFSDTTVWTPLVITTERAWIMRSIGVAAGTTTFQLSVSVSNGWNMVSVPGINPDGQGVSTWWSGLTGNVYEFVPGSGYNPITTTTPGEGYWMKNVGDNTYNTGDEWPAGGIQIVPHDPISATTGWNMFGGYEDILDVTLLTTTPSGQIIYPIYRFVPGTGYQTAATLDPGYGYWVKVASNCQINVPDVVPKLSKKAEEYFKDDWGKITVTDATGSCYTLYAVKGQVDLNKYELPPLPPAGTFDVRYSSGRIAEDIASSFQTIDLRAVVYPVKVKVENTDIRLQDVTGKVINTNIKSGDEITISNQNVDKLMVSGQLIPDKYALEQNYPNPFNPSTTIEFSLPENVKNVKITIYNVLGQKVAELINSEMLAGKYQYQWNAKNYASGMYIYELRTEKFVSIKKMMLLK